MSATPSGGTSGAGPAIPAKAPSKPPVEKVTLPKTGTNLDPVTGN